MIYYTTCKECGEKIVIDNISSVKDTIAIDTCTFCWTPPKPHSIIAVDDSNMIFLHQGRLWMLSTTTPHTEPV